MSDVDRKFSNGIDWDNSIDVDDASDGSEGGYDRHGSFINANGMMEIIKLRVENAFLTAERDALRAQLDEACEALTSIAEVCSFPKDVVHWASRDLARAVLEKIKGGKDEG